jgi:hypothetical protein
MRAELLFVYNSGYRIRPNLATEEIIIYMGSYRPNTQNGLYESQYEIEQTT